MPRVSLSVALTMLFCHTTLFSECRVMFDSRERLAYSVCRQSTIPSFDVLFKISDRVVTRMDIRHEIG